ncbi:MAG TPA: protein kinase [Anaerolineales bacterium]|nr:protein kinase [Anaerolineales bacterium]
MSESLVGATLVGRYQLLSRLGTGGMAHVFQARDLNLQRMVAIKLLREDLISDPAFHARFLQEARAAANLSHPNIVTIHDFGVEAHEYFFVMELVSGTDLKTLLRRRRRLAAPEALAILTQACAGVGYAHRAGLIHCDLKPQNILVAPDGRTKIADFGIARALSTIDPLETSEVVWGSPQYFAPEQAAGGPPSPASDVYSLGVILFETLTGRLPFAGEDPSALADQHLRAPPPSPRSLNPSIPPALDQVLLKVLSKEPAARYRTADQLGRVLSGLIPPAEGAALPASFPAAPAAHPEAPTTALAPAPAEGMDWLAIVLALLAFLAVGGLLPLWLWACLLYPACPLT